MTLTGAERAYSDQRLQEIEEAINRHIETLPTPQLTNACKTIGVSRTNLKNWRNARKKGMGPTPYFMKILAELSNDETFLLLPSEEKIFKNRGMIREDGTYYVAPKRLQQSDESNKRKNKSVAPKPEIPIPEKVPEPKIALKNTAAPIREIKANSSKRRNNEKSPIKLLQSILDLGLDGISVTYSAISETLEHLDNIPDETKHKAAQIIKSLVQDFQLTEADFNKTITLEDDDERINEINNMLFHPKKGELDE